MFEEWLASALGSTSLMELVMELERMSGVKWEKGKEQMSEIRWVPEWEDSLVSDFDLTSVMERVRK